MRIEQREFRARPLRVHGMLHDVPLEDAWAIPLSGGGAGRTIQDLRAVMVADVRRRPRWSKGSSGCEAASEPCSDGIIGVLFGTVNPTRTVSAWRIAPSLWSLQGHRTAISVSSTALRTSS